MASISETFIANLALSLLGQERIETLTEDSTAGRACNQWYEHCRRTVLSAHDWDVCTEKAILSRDASAPLYGYSYRYELPNNYMRLVEMNSGTDEYRIVRGGLETNASTVKIKYVYDETDVNNFSATMVDALTFLLASRIAVKVTGSEQMYDRFDRKYKDVLQDARFVNTSQKYPDTWDTGEWIEAHQGAVVDYPYRPIEDA